MSALPFSPSNLFDEGTSGDDWPSDNILSTRSLIGPAISDNDFVEWLQESQLQGTGPETEEDSRLQSVLKVSQKPNILSSFSPKKAKPQVTFKDTPTECKYSSQPLSPWELIRQLDEKENWSERNVVLTKEQHLENIECAKLILKELVNKVGTDCARNKGEENIKMTSLDDSDDFDDLPVKPRGKKPSPQRSPRKLPSPKNSPKRAIAKDPDAEDKEPLNPKNNSDSFEIGLDDDDFDNKPIKRRQPKPTAFEVDAGNPESKDDSFEITLDDDFDSKPIKRRQPKSTAFQVDAGNAPVISNENTIDDDGLASDLANLDALSAQFDSLSIRTPFKQTDDEDITLNKLETDTSEVSSTGHDRTSKANQKLAFDNTQDAFEKDSGSNEINQESNEFDKEFQVVDVKYNYNDENVKKTKSKGVTFDVDANDDIKVTSRDISSIGLQDADASINQSASDSLTKDSDSFGFNDDDFQPAGKAEFMEDLDFLEQCGDADDEARARQDALARQSLYVKFDPLVKGETPVKGRLSSVAKTALQSMSEGPEDSVPAAGKTPISDSVKMAATISSYTPVHKKEVVGGKNDPFSPCVEENIPVENKKVEEPKRETVIVNGDINGDISELVEPLLYTQKDLDEVLKARQNDFEEMLRARELEWKKEKKLFETKLQEEIAMRDLVEQDSKEKIDNLRKEILEMKKVVEEYEKHIIQLSENTQTDTLVKQEKFAEILREKEQLQQELNNTESSLYKAYKRMEELKEAVEQFQKNEQEYKAYQEQLKGQVNSTQQKYDKLRKHAEEKIEHANREIAKVRKEKESDLAGVQAALKKATSKIGSLEQQLQQKISENIELEKICDDLISRVSADS